MNTLFPRIGKIRASLTTLWRQGVHCFYRWYIAPKSISEDDRRREFILNIILLGTIGLLSLLDISILFSSLKNTTSYQGTPFWIASCVVLLFVGLLILSRKGFFKIVSYLLIGIYFILTMYAVLQWSLVLPTIILGSIIIIVISSILISTRFSFLATIIIAITVITITSLQIKGIIPVHLYWKEMPLKIKDSTEISTIFLMIAAISWLSNREIENSLRRARKSENELRIERDSLEIKVEERTKELKQLQMERVSELYRFAEFGKLSSGIFHDLMNPLHAVIGSIGQLEAKQGDMVIVKDSLEKAVRASRRMGDFLGTIKKQIKPTDLEEIFSLNRELREAVDVLQYKAREAKVSLFLRDPKELMTFGNPLKFHQIATNLISNAIDAYDGVLESENRTVRISLLKRDADTVLKVTDHGAGISPDFMEKMFDPFETTKPAGKGMGLGLATTKKMVEKDFSGTLSVVSTPGQGSSFSVTLKLVSKK